MSIIVAIRDGDEVCLGTDSRFMNADQTAIESDSVQKIFPIGSDGFIATSGFRIACDFLQTRAPQVARELRTADIGAIGESLALESLDTMREQLAALRYFYTLGGYEHIGPVLSGESLLGGFMLVGRNSQEEVGLVTIIFRVTTNQLMAQKSVFFGPGRGSMITLGAPSVQDKLQALQRDKRVTSLAPILAVRRVIQEAKCMSTMVGGPAQIVIVDSTGARWIDRPSAQDEALPESGAAISTMIRRVVAHGTISGVSSISTEGVMECVTFSCSGLDIDAGGNLSAPSVAASGNLGGSNVVCGNSLTVDTALVKVNGSYGITATFQDKAGNTHNVVGGIITS